MRIKGVMDRVKNAWPKGPRIRGLKGAHQIVKTNTTAMVGLANQDQEKGLFNLDQD